MYLLSPGKSFFYFRRLACFKSLPTDKQDYCRTCSLLILDEARKHSNHDIVKKISSEHLVHPSLLFKTHENKKVEAVKYILQLFILKFNCFIMISMF